MRNGRTFKALHVLALAAIAAGPVRSWAADSKAKPRRGEKYALLVGVQNYEGELNPLRFSEADVLDLAGVLKETVEVPADQIALMTQRRAATSLRFNPTRENILRQLDLLVSGLQEQDTLIVALAGHGLQFEEDNSGERYFCPIDARLKDRETLIPLSAIRRKMEERPARLKLLFVDACRDSPVKSEARGSLPSVRVLERIGGPRKYPGSVIAFYSCSEGQKAYEDEKARHGVFFRYLIEGLGGQADRDGDGVATLGELQSYVNSRVTNFVRDRHGQAQQPELVSNTDLALPLVVLKPQAHLLRQGKDLFERRKYGEVVAVLSRMLQSDPTNGEAYHLRGKARIMEDAASAKGAIEDFTEAIRHAKDLAEAYVDRGYLYLDGRDYDRAIADFTEAIRLNVPGSGAPFFRGLAYINTNRAAEAIADFTEAIRLKPDFADAYHNRGDALLEKGQLAGALADFDRAIALDPKSAPARISRGGARLKSGDFDGAIEDLDQAVALARRSGDFRNLRAAYFNRGRGWFLKKDYKQAIADWDRVAENSNDRTAVIALDFLGLAHLELRDEARAARYFEQAVRADDPAAYAPPHAHLAQACYRRKDYETALRETTLAIKLDDACLDAFRTRVLTLRALGRPAEAEADEKRMEELQRR